VKNKNLIIASTITIAMLIFLNILSSTVFPILGFHEFRLPFNILIILFLGFKLETPFTAILILGVQLFQAAFTIEGWAYGTFAGVLLCIVVGFVRDLLNFSTKFSTVIVTQIFQTLWFSVTAVLIYIRTLNIDYIIHKFQNFIPESIIISLLSPYVFGFLDRIWKIKQTGSKVRV
jgi:hypothetical protein